MWWGRLTSGVVMRWANGSGQIVARPASGQNKGEVGGSDLWGGVLIHEKGRGCAAANWAGGEEEELMQELELQYTAARGLSFFSLFCLSSLFSLPFCF